MAERDATKEAKSLADMIASGRFVLVEEATDLDPAIWNRVFADVKLPADRDARRAALREKK